jgi:hypothetical protein
MFAKIAKWLGGAVVVVLSLVGVLAVVVVWNLGAWFKAWGEPVVKPVPAVVSVVPAVDAPPPGEVCSCGSGVQCTGSRGGRFCVDESGNKRYK